MGYEAALEKGWADISTLTDKRRFSVMVIADTYDIDVENRTVNSVSCNIPVKDSLKIILLHYLARKLKLSRLPEPSGEWVDFRQLEGGGPYYPVFKKRVTGRILKKYGSNPEGLATLIGRLPARRVAIGDIAISIDALEGVPILVTMAKGDEEFGPDANMLFDGSISSIFCTEDIVVLAELVAHIL